MAQAATGLADFSTSTRHILQLPEMERVSFAKNVKESRRLEQRIKAKFNRACDGESVVITEPGDLHSDQSRRLEDSCAGVNQNLFIVFNINEENESQEYLRSDLLTIDKTFKLLSSPRHRPRSIFDKRSFH